MGNKCSSRYRAAVCAAILPVVANAQDTAIDRIEAIERQIRGLQGELQRLKSELGEAKQQLRQSRGGAQRAQEELRQARKAAERARQDALEAATAEPQTRQTAPQVQAAASATADASAGVKVGMPEGRPTIATADGRLSFAIGGLVQFDMGGYFQNPNQNTQFPRLNDRARHDIGTALTSSGTPTLTLTERQAMHCAGAPLGPEWVKLRPL